MMRYRVDYYFVDLGIRTRRLKTGRHVFMERGPELGGQSQDSLRRVVPQGSAITERAMAQ